MVIFCPNWFQIHNFILGLNKMAKINAGYFLLIWHGIIQRLCSSCHESWLWYDLSCNAPDRCGIFRAVMLLVVMGLERWCSWWLERHHGSLQAGVPGSATSATLPTAMGGAGHQWRRRLLHHSYHWNVSSRLWWLKVAYLTIVCNICSDNLRCIIFNNSIVHSVHCLSLKAVSGVANIKGAKRQTNENCQSGWSTVWQHNSCGLTHTLSHAGNWWFSPMRSLHQTKPCVVLVRLDSNSAKVWVKP